MYRPTATKRFQVVSALVEGSSINSIVPMTGAAKHTALSCLGGALTAASNHRHDPGLRARRIHASAAI
jgi:deoxyhypusine synthase